MDIIVTNNFIQKKGVQIRKWIEGHNMNILIPKLVHNIVMMMQELQDECYTDFDASYFVGNTVSEDLSVLINITNLRSV